MIKECLAIGIILLFVGVTITPTINFNTVKASSDDDLVKVTTQTYGIKGYWNTTMKFTREQYQNLGEYLAEFRARLNQTLTREKAVPLFKDTVVNLDKYGLLLKGMLTKHPVLLIIVKIQLLIRFYRALILEFISVAEIPEAPDEIVYPLLYLYSLWLMLTFQIESEFWVIISSSLGWNWPSFPFF